MATIREVAALAGVSPATVSRVINGNHPVKAETRASVERAIRELDFHPSIAGQALSRKEKQTVLLVTSSTMTEQYQHTLQGINEVLVEESMDLLITNLFEVPGDPETMNWRRSYQYVEGGLAGGVILIGTQPIISAAEAGVTFPIPAVTCAEHLVSAFPNSVSCNNQAATHELTQRLISQGYRRFAFISSKKSYENEPSDFSRDRKQGMLQALAEAGLPWDAELEICVEKKTNVDQALHYENAALASRYYLQLPPERRPDVILCTEDTIAAACQHTLQEGGLTVPDDVAVAGFDNSFLSQICYPKLTTIQTPNYEMGMEAARLLISLMRGQRRSGMGILLPHAIWERGSTLKK